LLLLLLLLLFMQFLRVWRLVSTSWIEGEWCQRSGFWY